MGSYLSEIARMIIEVILYALIPTILAIVFVILFVGFISLLIP